MWTARQMHRALGTVVAVLALWQTCTGATSAVLDAMGHAAAAKTALKCHTGSIVGWWVGTLHPILSGIQGLSCHSITRR